MGITDAKLLFFHGISGGNEDKEITMREYNDRTVFGCFENPFPNKCGIPALNLPTVAINGSPLIVRREDRKSVVR